MDKLLMFAIVALFSVTGLIFFIKLHSLFYLLNFSFIGIMITLSILLYMKKHPYSRQIIQLIVGSYLLVILGLLKNNNLQIEGFLYYLTAGIFTEAVVIHYFAAKIGGPLFFGRGFCGYACWTAMLLDLLPYKMPEKAVSNQLRYLRYFIFSAIFIGVIILRYFKTSITENALLVLFIISNLLYYTAGIILAFIYKDNRAFCKYLCPITVFLKPASYFSLLRIKVDPEKCTQCKKCINSCPMQVDMLNPKRTRKNGTECILCLNCIQTCPNRAAKII